MFPGYLNALRVSGSLWFSLIPHPRLRVGEEGKPQLLQDRAAHRAGIHRQETHPALAGLDRPPQDQRVEVAAARSSVCDQACEREGRIRGWLQPDAPCFALYSPNYMIETSWRSRGESRSRLVKNLPNVVRCQVGGLQSKTRPTTKETSPEPRAESPNPSVPELSVHSPAVQMGIR